MKHINSVHLENFEQTKKETAFSCTHCEFECIRIDQLKDHINSIHGQSKPYSRAGILQDTLEKNISINLQKINTLIPN